MVELNTYPDGTPFTGHVSVRAQDSSPAWPVRASAPHDAPNVLIVLLDDLGFAQLGCYGGLGDRVHTPNIDRLAASGIRYQNFHTTALCSPTRAALLTGRNNHSVGVATIMERATGYPGYNGRIPRDSAMLPAVLKEHGYNTMMVGKWHLTPDEESTEVGPFDRWPLGQGFERFYGFLPGETSQWQPDLWADNHRVDAPATPEEGYHLTTDLIDTAIGWIGTQKAIAPSKPFFLYCALGAMHSPHHVAPSYIEQFRGVFDDGWDVIRAETLARQIELGILPDTTTLPPSNPGVSAWNDLTDTQRTVFARQMETYAGFLAHTDEQIGRLLDFLEDAAIRDNTLVMLMSDNGASAEGGPNGLLSELSYFNGEPETLDEMVAKLDEWGSPSTHPHYASGWAMAGNAPNRLYKAFVHEGGTRDPFIVSWPGHLTDPGSIRNQFHHVVDVTSTVMELLELDWPEQVAGVTQRPLEGESLLYTFTEPDAPTRKQQQYFEMFAHRALWADGWKAVTLHWSKSVFERLGRFEHELNDGDWDADVWELYHLDTDPSEAHDLAASHPEKLEELKALWWADAEKYNVLPLDDTLLPRLLATRPLHFEPRAEYVYTAPMRLSRPSSPDIRDRSHTITARFTTSVGDEGVIVSNGGMDGGFTLCLLDGRLHYVSNFLGRTHSVIAAPEALPAGDHLAVMTFTRTGRHAGHATLSVDGTVVGETDVPRTNPIAFASAEGLEVGSDSTSPIWDRYRSPFTFTGTIREIRFTVADDAQPNAADAAAQHAADMTRQ